jgi:hypothetical protein
MVYQNLLMLPPYSTSNYVIKYESFFCEKNRNFYFQSVVFVTKPALLLKVTLTAISHLRMLTVSLKFAFTIVGSSEIKFFSLYGSYYLIIFSDICNVELNM